MDKYVRQLIADIYAGQNWEDSECTFFTKAEQFFQEEKTLFEQPFGKTCGVQKIQFPPIERLTDVQMEGICEAIERLLFSWNIFADLPDGLPVKFAYELLVSIFEQKISIVSTGQTGVEFCNSVPKTCPFGAYCECRKIDEAIDHREKLLGKKVLKLVAKIRMAPSNLPDPDIFSLIYPKKSRNGKPIIPVKSIREWLGFDADFFPSPDDLTNAQTEAISEALLQFMNENIRLWVSKAAPKLRYISLVGYLNLPAQYDGQGGFVLYSKSSADLKKRGRRFDDFNRREEQ